MQTKTVRRILIHGLAFVLVAFCLFKFPEEIAQWKLKLYAAMAGTGAASPASGPTEAAATDSLETEPAASAAQRLAEFSEYPPMTHAGTEWYLSTRLIYHAAGGIDGLSYTNSREAMEQCIRSGNTVIEVDFHFTSDGHLVCVHEWSDISGSNEAIPLDAFQASKIYGKYTPMTGEDVVRYMAQNPELYIVIDTKADAVGVVRALAALCDGDRSILDRFIIQLYRDGEKQAIREIYPFKDENFLFTLYIFGQYRYEDILRTCYEENIPVIAVGYTVWDQETKEAFRDKGIVIFEHTINRLDQAKDALDKGAHGIYTDFLTEADIQSLMIHEKE